MSVGLEIKHWRIYVITLNFKFRQYLIYLVLSIVSGLLIKEGAYLLILIIFVYFKRFPKTYWCYFLISFLSVVYVNLTFQSLQLDDSQPIYVKEAKVIEVKKQSDDKQTAKIDSEAGQFYLTLQASEPKLLPGDWIRVETEVADVQNPTVPHAFSFKRYLQSNGMKGSLYLTSTEVISHVRVAKLGHMYAEEKETVIGFMLLTASLTSAIRLVRWVLDQQMQTLHKCQDLQSRLHMLPFHEESLHFQRPHFNLVSLPLLLFDLV